MCVLADVDALPSVFLAVGLFELFKQNASFPAIGRALQLVSGEAILAVTALPYPSEQFNAFVGD